MSGINMLDIWGKIFAWPIKWFWQLWFALLKAIAWVLDCFTQLFYIFSGMTPVSSPMTADGVDQGTDILNFFIQQEQFTKAYGYLCLVALGFIIVFTIGKIIKQDYFDRSGPRSKAPIFRSVALSFIAFICVIPIFMFLIQAAGALALLVMRALGYEGGGVGSMLFSLSWSDSGEEFLTFVETNVVGKTRDMNNFGWIDDNNALYLYLWDTGIGGMKSGTQDFYWWMFLFTGLVLILNLGKMILAMVTRLYKLVALFIIAPSPISQIVIDDGHKFKKWKEMVIQEALKVVGCVMCFLIFLLIASAVPQLDLMKFAYTPESAGYVTNIIEGNNFTSELSYSINSLYYSGGENPGTLDNVVNALGRCMLLVAGVGAIQDMDQVITPLLSGGTSSMDMGATGGAIVQAGTAAAKGAWELGKLGVKGAVGLANIGIEAGKGIKDKFGKVDNVLEKDKAGIPKPELGTENKGSNVNGDPIKNQEQKVEEANEEFAKKNEAFEEAENAVKAAEENEKAINANNEEISKLEEANKVENISEDDKKKNDEKIAELKRQNEELGKNPTVEQAKKTQEKAKEELDTAKANKDTQTNKLEELKGKKQKVTQSKENMEKAKETLEAVKNRDSKQRRILDDIENIEKSTAMSDEEKQQRIAELSAEYDNIAEQGPRDENGNSITEKQAQTNYEAAKAAYAQDNKDYVAAGGENDETAVESVEGQSTSTGTTETVTNTGTGTTDTTTQTTSTAGTEQQETTTSGGGSDSTSGETPTKYSQAAMEEKAKAAKRGIVTRGILSGVHKMNVGFSRGGLKAAGIIAKTLLQMTGMGKLAKGIETVEKDVKEGIHHTFGKDKDPKTGEYKYHSALGEALGGVKNGISNHFSSEQIAQRRVDRLNAKYDKADIEAKAALERQELSQSNNNIQSSIVGEDENISNEDLLNKSQNMIDNSNNLGTVAEGVNNQATQNGQGNSNLSVNNDRVNTYNNHVDDLNVKRTNLSQKSENIANIRAKRSNPKNVLSNTRMAVVDGIVELYNGANDEGLKNQLEEAYLHAVNHNGNIDKLSPELRKAIQKTSAYKNTMNQKGSFGHREQDSIEHKEIEEKFEEQMLARHAEPVKKAEQTVSTFAGNMTSNERRIAATRRATVARNKLMEEIAKPGSERDLNKIQEYRQELTSAMEEISTSSGEVNHEMLKTYDSNNGTPIYAQPVPAYKKEKAHKHHNNYQEQVGRTQRLLQEATYAGIDVSDLQAEFDNLYNQGTILEGNTGTTDKHFKGVGNKINKIGDKIAKRTNKYIDKTGRGIAHGVDSVRNGLQDQGIEVGNVRVNRSTTNKPVTSSTPAPKGKTKKVDVVVNTGQGTHIDSNIKPEEQITPVGTSTTSTVVIDLPQFIGVANKIDFKDKGEREFFANSFEQLDRGQKFNIADAQFEEALRNLIEKDPNISSEVKDNYDKIQNDYNNAIELARTEVNNFKSSGDVSCLERARERIRDAMKHSTKMNELKDEYNKK